MLIGFLIVFVILAKVGWPMIMGAVEQRNTQIADSLLAAEEANNALAGIEQKRQETMAMEAEKIVTDARLKIEKEQAEAMAQIKNEVIALSVDIAEKLLQRELHDKQSQSAYIEQLLRNNQPRIEA